MGRGGMKARVNICIEDLDHLADFRNALIKDTEYLRLALMAMGNIGLNKGLRFGNGWAVRWPDRCEFTAANVLKAMKVVAHMTIGRAHHTCGPTHNMIAAKQDIFFP